MKHLFNVRAQTLSQRERVAAEQPGEGLPPSPFASAKRFRAKLCEIETPHPPPPAALSPFGRGLASSLISRIRRPRSTRPRDISRASNFFDNPVEPFLYFVIGEAKLDESMAFYKFAPRFIALDLIVMMFAVDLDRQAEVIATEIHDEAGDGHLPAKFHSVQPMRTKLLPENIFRRSALSAQTPRKCRRSLGHHSQFGWQPESSQPLTRRLRRHPLPPGEG